MVGVMVASLAVLASGPSLDDLRPLVGEWVGEGTGKPGEGTGAFSFAPSLDGRILVRNNRADYPAAEKKPATTHMDLMFSPYIAARARRKE